jgi:hypothetical protein
VVAEFKADRVAMKGMRWVVRIFTGLIAVTASYIWTVGQTGMSSTDEHLCELARVWFGSLLPNDQCVAHEWYIWIWAIGAVLAFSFIFYDIATWLKESRRVIIFGLFLIVSGVAVVGLGLWRPAPEKTAQPAAQEQIAAATASIRAELENTKQRLAAYLPKPAAPPAPLRYTAYEKGQRLQAVDEIYKAITAKLSPVYDEGQELFEKVRTGTADVTTAQALLGHAENVERAVAELSNIRKRYEYFTDIIEASKGNNFNGVGESTASKNLAGEIGFWASKLPTASNMKDIWNRDMTLFEAWTAHREFDDFLKKTLPMLRQKRAEIEAAELARDG